MCYVYIIYTYKSLVSQHQFSQPAIVPQSWSGQIHDIQWYSCKIGTSPVQQHWNLWKEHQIDSTSITSSWHIFKPKSRVDASQCGTASGNRAVFSLLLIANPTTGNPNEKVEHPTVVWWVVLLKDFWTEKVLNLVKWGHITEALRCPNNPRLWNMKPKTSLIPADSQHWFIPNWCAATMGVSLCEDVRQIYPIADVRNFWPP